MIDKIVELENNKSYVILDETSLEDKKYYFGLRLNDNEEPTNNYSFFVESKDDDKIFLTFVEDKELRKLLLSAFTINLLEGVYYEEK